MEVVWVFMLGLSLLIIIGLRSLSEKEKKERERIKAMQDQKEYLKEHGFPPESKPFNYISGIPGYKQAQALFVTADNTGLKFLDENDNMFILPISDVNFYSIKGDLKTVTEFVGGKSQGVGTTMVTEGVFGTAAAMKGNKQPLSNVKTVDERRTIINADIDGENTFVFFHKGDLYNYLLERIPQKEQSFMTMQKT
jgi:hypothetical protein